MFEDRSIRKWQEEFKQGMFEEKDVDTQINAGWFDWFCEEILLPSKTEKLGKIVVQLQDSKRVTLDTMYVFFKNNCPAMDPLYDDFRICDRKTQEVLYTVAVDDKREEEKYTVYGRENDFERSLASFNRVDTLVEWLNMN